MQRKSVSRVLVLLMCAGMFQIFPLDQFAQATPPKGSVEFTYTNGGSHTPAQHLSFSNIQLTGDFTIETWVKFKSTNHYSSFLGQYGSTKINRWIFQNFNDALKFQYHNSANQEQNLHFTNSVPLNQWMHLAVVRSGSTLKSYYNGSNANTNTGVTQTIGADVDLMLIGAGPTCCDRFDGFITNYRITNTAVYTSNFTPSLTPLTAITGTQVLLNMTNDANYLLDSSSFNRTVTSYSYGVTDYASNGRATSSSQTPFPKATPTFSWANQTKAVGDANFKLTAPTPSTPGTFTYSSANTGVISLDATYTDSATVGVSGSSVITASFTPTDSASYTSATTTMTLTVNKQAQAAVVLSLSSSINKGLGSKAITFSTTGGSDTGTVSYSVKSGGTASGCSLSKANTSTSDTITATSTGTCLLQAVKAETNNFATETSTAVTFNFLAAQTFAYDSGTATSGTIPTGGTYYSGDTITVSSGSGLTKPGFKLNGWKNNSNVSYAAGSTFTISASDTLTAQWRQASLFGIADADLTEVQNWNVIDGFSAGGNIGNGTDTFTVTVPANSLPAGTAVKLYALSSTALAQSKIGAGNTYILNMVVAWLYGQTVPTASSAVTLKIESPSIKKDAVAYMIIGDTVTAVGTATQDGVINTYFTEDPVITVVNPVVQNNNGGGGGGGGGNAVVTVEKPVEVVVPVEISKPVTSKLISMSTKVYFGLDASWINSLNIKSVKAFMAKVSSRASIKEVSIQGFTQPTAINPDPLGLSKARANSVAKLVKGLGIPGKVVAVGKGNEKKNLPSSRYVLVTVTGEAKS
jgi:outer membrane protein OmpA-like peptidoglycan-associated protein